MSGTFLAPLAQAQVEKQFGLICVTFPICSLNIKIWSMTEIDPFQLRANSNSGLALFDSKQKENIK